MRRRSSRQKGGTKKGKTKVLLVDGDYFVYLTCYSCADTNPFTGEPVIPPVDELIGTFNNTVEYYRRETGIDKTVIALSCDRRVGFRRDLCDTYKANREATKAPQGIVNLRAALLESHGAVAWPAIEADDVLGILATEPVEDEERYVLSCDKDFLGVPCRYFRVLPNRKGLEYHETDPERAFRFFSEQVLKGDPVDGYHGLYGVGDVKAAKIIGDATDPVEVWDRVVKAYAKWGKTEEDAILTARLAHILQHGEYNKDTGEVTLWTPPQNH